jgi:deazaflavin-dependent oxidoreductase (nitroreductase family)
MFFYFEQLEAEFFRMLNRIVTPIVRAGFGSPGLFPLGAIVVETKGRKTGLPSSVPLMAARAGDLVIVSTVRRRSDWFKNLSAQPNVRYWLSGREVQARAFAIGNGIVTGEDAPERTRCLVDALRRHSALFGTCFAILIPSRAAS